MIKVDRLMKRVNTEKNPVLNDISFQMEKGEMIGLIGGSGSGKSLLMSCLALREKWDGGRFLIDGDDMLKPGGKKKVRREWAYLEQNPTLNMNRKALKNVLIGQSSQTPLWRMATGMVRSDDYMGAMDTIEHLGLLDKAHRKASELSGGERQRIAIARALVHGAKVILADEPVMGLDPKSAEHVLQTLKSLCEEERLTVIAVIPLELAERYCSRIMGLAGGQIVVDVTGRRLTHGEKSRI
ncbi:phosphonate transport system ATP-binding protein [Paenibacillus uliginis N3/975]|uniref:Phosphonate transport system ATP-binding protein n=1 Tax=Paenibacillus uliginis N3/975 TaxID=1313296 RepID=A0A1X7HGF1_9BACL|nr:ATP-binding cassette domain-containing protein [Paenibacillus uliginis]SMF86269.1 phosphonate transport system ATP-binding protein [Paenibacillus uliginis N3/975]